MNIEASLAKLIAEVRSARPDLDGCTRFTMDPLTPAAEITALRKGLEQHGHKVVTEVNPTRWTLHIFGAGAEYDGRCWPNTTRQDAMLVKFEPVEGDG